MNAYGMWPGLMAVVWVAALLVPAWRITQKAGFHPALSLLVLIPMVNIIAVWLFAFTKWPHEREGS
jgi:hypothetical protein